MIEFSATVRVAQRNRLGQLFTPLVLLRRFVQALALALERMIWRELIEDEAPAKPLVSLLAFLLFSGLCLLASLQGAVGDVIGLLLFLLPMEWQVLLQSWDDRFRLFADTPGGSERLEVDQAAITAVLIRQASRQLPLRLITGAQLLSGPEPRVILWSERRPPIVVDGLSGEREAAELLKKLQAALDPRAADGR